MPQITNYPGTVINEIDNSAQPDASYGTFGAVMGRASMGIANSKVLLNSQGDLLSTFGDPIVSGSYPLVSAIDYGIYAGLEMLKETGNLWYVRLTDGTEKYSSVATSGTAPIISAVASSAFTTAVGYDNGNTPSDIYDIRSAVIPANQLVFAAIGPGKYGDNFAVTVQTSGVSGVSSDWANLYDDKGSATVGEAKWKKIFKVNIFVKDSAASWTDVSASIQPSETFYGSTDFTLVDNVGTSLFIEDVINGKSSYVYVRAQATNGTLPADVTTVKPLTGGYDSSAISTPIDVSGLWGRFFSNKERNPIDVALALPRTMNAQTTPSEASAIDALIGTRYDFVSTVQVGSLTSTSFAAITADNTSVQGALTSNPSYFAKYFGWTLVYDSFNASRVYLPNCIYAAAVMLRTDRVSRQWEAPAGVERGIIASGKQNKDIAPLDGGKLYDLNVNTIKYVNRVGNVIWGQKTAQLKNTARNRINVRRALLYIEKNVENILNSFMFRGNTSKERERASSMINAFMSGVQTGGGVQSYKIVCDNTNNNSSSNTLVVDLYIQPTYTIEFIKLNTIISASSVTTAEV